ncbi:MAG TPA: phosphatase PAP2 family protein [Pseudonocardiaceae bacterium]|nr:phosphatase PAP2 family protein [Pseudonocardiaceae bacterium]
MNRFRPLLVSAVGLLVFGVLAVLVAVHWIFLSTVDFKVDSGLHTVAVREHWLVVAARVVSDLGSPLSMDLVTAVACLVLLVRRRFRVAVLVAAVRFGALGIESLTKVLLARPRPSLHPVLATASGYSYPSGHTTGTAAVIGVLLVLCLPRPVRGRWVAVLAAGVLFVLAVGTSRMVLGVHYPSDVLGGLCLGGAGAWCGRVMTLVPTEPVEDGLE